MSSEQARQQTAIAVSETPHLRVTPAPARLGFVDSLRALAALYVVVGHIGDEIWPKQPPPGPLGH